MREKKSKKLQTWISKGKSKKQKKFYLMKKFDEDKFTKEQKETLKAKYREVFIKFKKTEALFDGQEEKEIIVPKNFSELVKNIEADYFSDMMPDEIPDSDVSDIEIAEEEAKNMFNDDLKAEEKLSSQLSVQAKLTETYAKQNHEYMTKFVRAYSESHSGAKKFYYQAKLKFDVEEPEGEDKHQKVLQKYLEGLQWVLYYYYRGVQHWRWFYPFHYAPLISDFKHICQNVLDGKNHIETFSIDSNCSEENRPYTPFQQLLSILPRKSFHLLPPCYIDMIDGMT
jgi:5'-3' exonuclease